jgi:hypothetical protein
MNNNLQQSILDAFNFLPRSNDPFFRQLWHGKHLEFKSTDGKTDSSDIYAAQLVCASLEKKQSILLVLPDHASRRMPLVFVTGLVMHAVDFLYKADQCVIYFGTSATIKDYLSQAYIRKKKLSDIFSQTYIGHTSKPNGDITGTLPHVIFSYAPTNIDQIIETYHPKWVFIDCGDGERTDWIPPLLQKLTEKKINGIACVTNPLSSLSDVFEKNDWSIFSWGLMSAQESVSTTEITPIAIRSQGALHQAEKLQSANSALSECRRKINGRLQKDAYRAVGRYVSSLENLLVPLQFFEAESKHYWGISSIQTLRETAERFAEATATDGIGSLLEKVLVEARLVHDQFITNKPPIWLALEELCISPPLPEMSTILIFQNRAYKQLFSLAMLAENNIAEYELQNLNVWFANLKQFAQWHLQMEKLRHTGMDPEDIPSQLKNSYPHWHPILVGVPFNFSYARYAYLLHHDKVANLLLPHQIHLANWHYKQWINRFDQIQTKNSNLLNGLIANLEIYSPKPIENLQSDRIKIGPEKELLIDDETESAKIRFSKLLELGPRAEELAYLMDEFIIQREDPSVSDENIDSSLDLGLVPENAFVDRVIVIRFRENYECMFNLIDKIQVVVTASRGRDLQERSVRSLRTGDVVLFINGQQRQSLYDLILSRVHDHPTFSTHILLIERWQDELLACFKKEKLTLTTILAKMQAQGSKLQTETAIRFWLWGQVMCPSDSEDLKRIAEILNMPFVKQYYPQIDKAARRLRGIHISLARKLNTWLGQEAFSSNAETFNDIVDAELGLEFRDFRDALKVLTVETISEESGLFLTTDLGLLRIQS